MSNVPPQTPMPPSAAHGGQFEPSTGPTSGQNSGSTGEQVKQEAAQTGQTAVDAGRDVAKTAVSEAGAVGSEIKSQAADLIGTVAEEVRSQGSTQQRRLADGLHTMADDLGHMASQSDRSGPANDLAHEAARRLGGAAHWLQDREPSDVLEELRGVARRHPTAFLVGAGVAGLVVGRIARDLVAARGQSGASPANPARALPAADTAPTMPTMPAPATPAVERQPTTVPSAAPARTAPRGSTPDPWFDAGGEVR